MKNCKAFLFIIIFNASFFVSKAQQNDTLAQKLDEYLVSANKFYKFNGSALIAEKAMAIKMLQHILSTIQILFFRLVQSPNNLLLLLF